MSGQAALRIRILALVAAGALIVAGGVAWLLRNSVALRDSSSSVDRYDTYLAQVVAVEQLVLDTETGLRGYVITRDPLFLAPLDAARPGLPQGLAALRRSAASLHAFAPQVDGFSAAVRGYEDGYVPSVLDLVAHHSSRAQSVAVTLAGKRSVDAIRARTATLERLIAAHQASRQRAARAVANHSIAEAIAALVLLTLLTVLLGTYLGRLAVERERARAHSDEVSQSLQRSLLPRTLPAVPGCELAVRFVPVAGGLVGGDFYDVFEVAPGRWAVVLGDVCGKGPAAAAVTAMARWTLRSLAAQAVTPAQALEFLNTTMLRQDIGGRYIAIVYILLTVGDGGAYATIASAGHPPPVFVPRAGEPSAVDAHGDLIGVWSEVRLHVTELRLGPGDSLVAATDGISDTGPGPQRAPEQAVRERPAQATADQLVAALVPRTATDEQRDDIAILALRYVGPPEGADEPAGTPQAERVGMRP